mmetsp:Transcript_5228/g.7682  ORF Transcript_5228/g.7682 Transcript_5228/m.7682 type:complete len:367 (-) Transcript_5228:386-1486(-)
MATSMEENPSAVPDTAKDEPSFVTDDEETSEEEQEEVIESGGEEDDDDDAYALLALTKRRIQEQKEKEDESVPFPPNDEDDTVEEDEGGADGGDGEQEEEDEVAENGKDGGVVDENEHNDEKVSASDTVQQEISSSPSTSSKDEEKKEYSPGEEGGVPNAAGQLPRKSPDVPGGTYEANAELWALLNQSKKRLGGKAAVLNIDAPPKSPSRSTSGGVPGSPSQGGAPSAPAPKTQEDLLREVMEKKDKNAVTVQESINARRDMDKEDAELRALLDMTKKRLALAAEKAKTPEEKAAVKKKMENPYADLDVPEDQKQLLIAMAIAEEAARSGQETFATAELKTEDLSRSIDSFAFLKRKGKNPQQGS